MGTIRRQMISNAVKLLDLMLMVFSFGLSNLPVLIKVGLPTFTQFLEIRIKLRNFLVFCLLLLI